MNSIFLRIYGGMLAALVLVALLGVGTLHLVNEVRADQYREGLARGTFRLMADNLAPMNEVERKRALAVWSRLLGIPLELQALSEVSLESSERNRLQRGHVLVQQTGPHSAKVYGLLDGKQPLLLTGEIQQISEQLARATNYLLIDELVRERLAANPETLVVLVGAGFDSRAFRLKGGRWLEIDERSVIDRKEAVAPSRECPNPLTRVSIDFARESLAARLAPFATASPVVVICEGVTMYLEPAQVDELAATLKSTFPRHRVFSSSRRSFPKRRMR